MSKLHVILIPLLALAGNVSASPAIPRGGMSPAPWVVKASCESRDGKIATCAAWCRDNRPTKERQDGCIKRNCSSCK